MTVSVATIGGEASQATVYTPPPNELDAYLDLSAGELARLVLWLLIEEGLQERMSGFRHDSLAGSSRRVADVNEFNIL
jgi:hypothetical protein